MENENKTKKTEQRVVLNLSMDQANDLYEWLRNSRSELIGPDAKIEIVDRITNRLQKTITKHENSMEHEAFKMAEERDDRQDQEDAEIEEEELGHELAARMGVTGPEGN